VDALTGPEEGSVVRFKLQSREGRCARSSKAV
jgi:hypothetical protein